MNNIYCVINDGTPLTDTNREILFHIARHLCKTRKKRFESSLANGSIVVETRFKSSILATLVGFEFQATIELNTGTTKRVTYLVSPKDLPRLKPGEILVESWLPASDFESHQNN